jgi:hypothetical protein
MTALIVRDGLADHQRMLGFRFASSYGRDICESTNDGSWAELSNRRQPLNYVVEPKLLHSPTRMGSDARLSTIGNDKS